MKPLLTAALALSFLMTAFAASESPPPRMGSAAFRLEDLAVKPTGVGTRRDVADNPTPTLQRFECHISTLNGGCESHPPHQHPQEELIILKEGTLDVFINGRTQRIGAGSLFFFASYDWHNVRNVGTTPATYFVFNFATGSTRTIAAKPAAETASPDKLKSAVYDWEQLVATPTKVGARRGVFDGPTVTCRRLESHVTTLRAGEVPHPAHHHPDEEVVLVKDGTMEATINGVAHTGGVGSIFFFASNDEHGLRNVGKDTASYYIIRVATELTPPAAAKL